ncbi:O-acetylserine/cysteine efflux transporter [Nocardioides albertanoniae]|uniref:O-acetylserine/cysteine efflux transporter n=1 Tax=Nocardioides albertanoniae TaxID=1175486 RepID=A0A543A4K4_9ACTN|nr:O-acetylserine/cysteine efflux transporter [Nocardioides albertanoniae]
MVVAVILVDVNRRDSLLAVLVAVLWGFNFVAIDWGLAPREGQSVPPLLLVAVRFFLVAFPAVFLLPRPKAPWRVIVAVGAFMSLGQFGLLYTSMAVGMPPGLAGLVLQAQVVLTIVIAAGVLRERPSTVQVVGVLAGALGLLVVALGRGGHVPLGSLLLCLLAALSWAVGNVVSRAAKVPGGLALTVWSALVVPVPLLALSLVIDGPGGVRDGVAAFGWEALASTAYTVVLASFVGYGIFNSLLARHPASSVVPWILLVPPVAIGSAWLLLGETPSVGELAGGALLVLGALVAQGVLRAPRLGVSRAAVQGGESGLDPARGEVGGPLAHLVDGAERH